MTKEYLVSAIGISQKKEVFRFLIQCEEYLEAFYDCLMQVLRKWHEENEQPEVDLTPGREQLAREHHLIYDDCEFSIVEYDPDTMPECNCYFDIREYDIEDEEAIITIYRLVRNNQDNNECNE